ncbi:MAG: hypothetical protein DRJ03_23130, partial [Chloroflexi bacterium]
MRRFIAGLAVLAGLGVGGYSLISNENADPGCGFTSVLGGSPGPGFEEHVGGGGASIFDSTLKQGPMFPGGGWLHSGVIDYDPNIQIVGADVSGVYASSNGGESWQMWNYGLINDDEVDNTYGQDMVVVDHSNFHGVFMGTFGGLYKMDTSNGLSPWVAVTPITDDTYTSQCDVAWGGTRLNPMAFTSVDWDGGDMIVASPGRFRWARAYTDHNYNAGAYPEGSADATRHSLWYMDLSDETPAMAPWALFDVDAGQANDISVARNPSDELVALVATSKEGPALYDGTKWTNLGDNAIWYRYGGSTTTDPNWTTDGQIGALGTTQDEQVVVDVYLTSDMVGYCVLGNSTRASAWSSGVYRCDDVLSASTIEWHFIGDATNISIGPYTRIINDYACGQSSTYSDVCFAYLNVAEARGTTEDTLFVSGREGWMSYSRILVDNNDVSPHVATWEPLIWWDGNNVTPADSYIEPFDTNVIDQTPRHWGAQGIFELMIHPLDSNIQTAHPNARLLSTTDNWTTWTNGYSVEHGTDPEFFSGTGYDETCVNGMGIGREGGLFYSIGDVGPHVTMGTDWEWLDNLMSGTGTNTCADDDASQTWPNDTEFPGHESGGSLVIHDFNDTGRDAWLITAGDIIQRVDYNKMWLFHDSNDDGDYESFHITHDVLDLDWYKFLGHTHVWDYNTDTAYWTYSLYDASICDGGSIDIRTGIMSGTWSGSAWSTTPISHTGLPQGEFQGYESLALVDDRLFIGYRGTNETGGIWYLDSPFSGTWTQIYGAINGASSMEFSVMCMATDGNNLWFGTRGGGGGKSGLFLIEDPLTAPGTIEQLCNTPSDANMVPGLTDLSEILDDWYADLEDANKHILEVASVLPDPFDPGSAYFWTVGDVNDLNTFSGVWYYDGPDDSFTHLNTNGGGCGLGVNRGSVDYSPWYDPPRIAYGTHCNGAR